MKTQIKDFMKDLIDYSDIPEFEIDRIFVAKISEDTNLICTKGEDGFRDFQRTERSDGAIKITEDLI